MPFHRSYGEAADRAVVPKKDLISGMLRDAERRQRADDRRLYDLRGESTEFEVQGDSGASSAPGTSSGGALEVDWTLPGPASATYQIAVLGYITDASVTGTADLSVDSVGKTFSFNTGGASDGDSITDTKSGGDTVSLILTPTFGGGGTVQPHLTYSAIRVG